MHTLSQQDRYPIVQLAAGDEGQVSLKGVHFANGVTVTSAEQDHPAVLSGLKVSDSSGLNFMHVEFSLDPANKYFPITIGSSSDIDMSHMYVHGLLDGYPSNDAMPMNIRNSSNISVTESDFDDLHHAINFLDSDHVTVSGNSFHTMHSDGVRGGGTNDVVIR